MAGDCVAVRLCAAIFRGRSSRALHNILQWAIMLHEIEVCCRDRAQRYTVITSDRNRFEKNLWEDDGAAPVEIDATGMHALDERAEQAKVEVRGGAERTGIDGGMHVRNVGADREMNRDGNL